MLGDVPVERGVPREQALAELHGPARPLDVVDAEAGERQRSHHEHTGQSPRNQRGAQVAPHELSQGAGYSMSPWNSKYWSSGVTRVRAAGRPACSAAPTASHSPSKFR